MSARSTSPGSIEARRQERRATISRSRARGGSSGRKEQIGLARVGRRSETTVGASDADATSSTSTGTSTSGERHVRAVVGVFVEGSRRRGEPSLCVLVVLYPSGSLDGSMEEKADNGAPKKNGKTESAKDCAYSNEDCALRGSRMLHEGSVVCGRNGRPWVGRDGLEPG